MRIHGVMEVLEVKQVHLQPVDKEVEMHLFHLHLLSNHEHR